MYQRDTITKSFSYGGDAQYFYLDKTGLRLILCRQKSKAPIILDNHISIVGMEDKLKAISEGTKKSFKSITNEVHRRRGGDTSVRVTADLIKRVGLPQQFLQVSLDKVQ
jgi:hypothetical protein